MSKNVFPRVARSLSYACLVALVLSSSVAVIACGSEGDTDFGSESDEDAPGFGVWPRSPTTAPDGSISWVDDPSNSRDGYPTLNIEPPRDASAALDDGCGGCSRDGHEGLDGGSGGPSDDGGGGDTRDGDGDDAGAPLDAGSPSVDSGTPASEGGDAGPPGAPLDAGASPDAATPPPEC